MWIHPFSSILIHSADFSLPFCAIAAPSPNRPLPYGDVSDRSEASCPLAKPIGYSTCPSSHRGLDKNVPMGKTQGPRFSISTLKLDTQLSSKNAQLLKFMGQLRVKLEDLGVRSTNMSPTAVARNIYWFCAGKLIQSLQKMMIPIEHNKSKHKIW